MLPSLLHLLLYEVLILRSHNKVGSTRTDLPPNRTCKFPCIRLSTLFDGLGGFPPSVRGIWLSGSRPYGLLGFMSATSVLKPTHVSLCRRILTGSLYVTQDYIYVFLFHCQLTCKQFLERTFDFMLPNREAYVKLSILRVEEELSHFVSDWIPFNLIQPFTSSWCVSNFNILKAPALRAKCIWRYLKRLEDSLCYTYRIASTVVG